MEIMDSRPGHGDNSSNIGINTGGGRGHWILNYTGPEGLMKIFYRLDLKLDYLLCY